MMKANNEVKKVMFEYDHNANVVKLVRFFPSVETTAKNGKDGKPVISYTGKCEKAIYPDFALMKGCEKPDALLVQAYVLEFTKAKLVAQCDQYDKAKKNGKVYTEADKALENARKATIKAIEGYIADEGLKFSDLVDKNNKAKVCACFITGDMLPVDYAPIATAFENVTTVLDKASLEMLETGTGTLSADGQKVVTEAKATIKKAVEPFVDGNKINISNKALLGFYKAMLTGYDKKTFEAVYAFTKKGDSFNKRLSVVLVTYILKAYKGGFVD